MTDWFGRLAISALALASVTTRSEARITHLEITKTEPAFDGQSFGDAGAYEHLAGRVTGELDPADSANSGIQDINLAPRNVRGMVEYVTNIELLKPADMARGNRILFFEVNNRGNKLAPGSFNAGVMGGVADRNALSSAGDGWLMRKGYTMVWFGWEMDVRPGMSRISMPPIVVHGHEGSAITGIVRSEIITPVPATSVPISLSQQIQNYPIDSYDSYPTANVDNSASFADGFLPTLTVRAREQDPREPIPNSAWRFGTCDQGGASTPDEKHLCYRDGFKPGHLYELVYRAKDPTVGGFGFAAARDLGRFLRNSDQDDSGTANPVYRPDNLAIIEGSSQSGRMVRSLLALGFNRDETGRRVFDGAFPHIGGGLMPLNVRFGQPVRAWGEQSDHLYPAYDFPFTYARQTDPLTQRTGGLFDRCEATATCPKLFHVATALEMWEGRQSLGLTDALGRTDVADRPNVRTYIMASTQHGPAQLPLATRAPFGNCQQQPNPNPQDLDDARSHDRVHGMGARWRRAAVERQAEHRRRHACPSGSGSLARDSGKLLRRGRPSRHFAPQNLRHSARSRFRPALPPRRFQWRDYTRAAASRIGKLRRPGDAGRRRWQRLGRHSFGLPAGADRHVYRLESGSQGPLRERHVQFAGQLHSLHRYESRGCRGGRCAALDRGALSDKGMRRSGRPQAIL